MLLWYAGLSLGIVWNVFRDPAVDHRALLAGALLPNLLDLPWGRPAFFHTFVAAAAVLAVVMIATQGRRLLRRRLLFLPIGMFLHLVLDGTWTKNELMAWPVLGTDFPDGDLIPPVVVTVLMELAGAWALVWFVRRFALNEPERLRYFVRSGRLTNVER